MPAEQPAGFGALPHVGLIADLREERWPSMDLVAEMLLRHLREEQRERVSATLLRPAMRRRTSGEEEYAGRGYTLDRLLNRFWDYPRWLRGQRRDFDLFHLIDHSYAQLLHELPAGRAVVTCHDIDTFRSVLEPERERRGLAFRRMVGRTLSGLRRAARIICVSEPTRRDVLRHDILPPNRVVTIPNGVHPACSPLPCPELDAAASAMLGVADDTPVVVHVGSTIARKRIDVLLRVFAAVREKWPLARLVRVGSAFTAEQERLRDELGIGDAIIYVPFVTHDLLAAIYRRAWVVLITSDSEGFGLPLVEAGACGAPVVASDIPVLREVGGDAVVYRAIAAVEAWSQAVSDILTERRESSAARAQRRDAAIENAARFSWSLNAAKTVELYRDVLAT